MDFSILFILTIFIIGLAGSFVSGMVGVGGAIINFPLLLYIPPLLGVGELTSYEVSGITAFQVLFATLGGVWSYRKDGYVNKTILIYMGTGILAGSLSGAYLSSFMPESAINIVYGLLAVIAAFMMLFPKKDAEVISFREDQFKEWLAAVLALIVGVGAGIVGAGGAFILVPIMLIVLKVPTRVTIASSLAITFISSIGTSAGKIFAGNILVVPAIVMVAASLIAAPLGARIGKKVNTKILQRILAFLISGTAIKIWIDILF